MTSLKVGANLVAIARQRAGLSQRTLAARLSVPPSTVARWESGERAASMDTVQSVARACGLELAFYLANGDDSYVFDVQRRLKRTPAERIRALARFGTDPLQIAAALYSAEVRYVLVGAVAAAARGWPILLGRGEYLIVPEDSQRNLTRLHRAASALGATDPEIEDPHPGAEVISRWPLPDGGSLAASTYPIGTRGYRDLRRGAHETALGDAVVEVATVRDLIRMADANPYSEMRSFLPALWATLEQIERDASDHAASSS
jgi:transcriptional regulator with XRE-family HTH domain